MKVTAAQRKLIGSLGSARQRRADGLFVAEGLRSLRELLPAFGLRWLVATPAWLEEHGDALRDLAIPADRLLTAPSDELRRMSSMQTPQGVLAVLEMPVAPHVPVMPDKDELMLALDTVQDPGNLGTIVRVADWFGIRRILASEGTADLYNPKVVQATMGALARVKVIYCNLAETLARYAAAGVPVYGTFLDGRDLYGAPLTRGGVIVMGNEGNGITAAVGAAVTERIKIPPYPGGADTVESLNVGTAAAITVAEFRRRLR